MKHKLIKSITLLISLFVVFTGALYLYGKENATSTANKEVEKTQTKQITNSTNDTVEEESNSEDNLSEGIKDAFSHVIEGAKGIFIRENLDIVALGDSLTEGVGDSTNNGGYVGIVESTLQENKNNVEINIKNFGKRGNRTDQLLKRLEEEKISSSIEESDLILITIGANDIMKVVKKNATNLNYQAFVQEQNNYRNHLQDIFTTIRNKNEDASIYLIGLYNPFNQYFSNIPELEQIIYDWNRISKEVVSENEGVQFIPIKDLFENPTQPLYSEDNFHPNENGYKLMAKRVLESIKDDIEKIENEDSENTMEDENNQEDPE
ncbi:SGNH/GDSL hydrolase family protein [Pontibacillus yanchengensis]|uniref:SGNH/GDSL hydrolase family protein n=1 Tax=Pontibacillus yanchengensis TaxID=462910 RepID=UPI003C6E1622